MNIKKVIVKAIAFSVLAVSTATVGVGNVTVRASEESNSGWKTLVLICPRAEIQRTPYVSAGTTVMFDSEVEKVKSDAKIMEETINDYSAGRAKMTVDVAVSDIPIENKSLSMAYGPYIGAYNVETILDKYAPQGKYDSILLVYRNKDFTTSLGTANVNEFPMNGYDSTNGAIYSTVKLDDEDHTMNYIDKNVPMYLIDRFADGTYWYLKNKGFSLDQPDPPCYNGGDEYQFNKYKRNYYRWYFFGLKWTEQSIGGITEEMWKSGPTSK